MNNESMELKVEIIKHETDSAILIVYEGDDYWLPLSQVYRITRSDPPVLLVATWLCKRYGFID